MKTIIVHQTNPGAEEETRYDDVTPLFSEAGDVTLGKDSYPASGDTQWTSLLLINPPPDQAPPDPKQVLIDAGIDVKTADAAVIALTDSGIIAS